MTLVRFLTVPFFLAGLLCCGATTVSESGDGGPGGTCPVKLSGTPTGRPVAAMCPPTTTVPAPAGDAGPTSCSTDADCATDALYAWCRAGKCVPDQCTTDADCASGQACACASEQTGNAVHTNRCVATQCRADSDCGAGEVCSPTVEDLCSSGPFFACRSSKDECRVDADCCASAPACRYQASVGHWQCAAQCTVSG